MISVIRLCRMARPCNNYFARACRFVGGCRIGCGTTEKLDDYSLFSRDDTRLDRIEHLPSSELASDLT